MKRYNEIEPKGVTISFLISVIIFITLLFTSCGYETLDINSSPVITEIGTSDYQNRCYYIGKGSKSSAFVEIFSSAEFIFYDSCGKYQIGDTIKIVKR